MNLRYIYNDNSKRFFTVQQTMPSGLNPKPAPLGSVFYYPPYHSKYNPVERVWGVLENYWKGQLLECVEKVVGLARTMAYNGINPVAKLINETYEKGVKLTQKAMQKLEKIIERVQGIEKWAVDIPCY